MAQLTSALPSRRSAVTRPHIDLIGAGWWRCRSRAGVSGWGGTVTEAFEAWQRRERLTKPRMRRHALAIHHG